MCRHMLRARDPQVAAPREALSDALKRVAVLHAFDAPSLLGVVEWLAMKMQEQANPVHLSTLLVIDSASAVLKPVLGVPNAQGLALMNALGHALKFLAKRHRLAVLVRARVYGQAAPPGRAGDQSDGGEGRSHETRAGRHMGARPAAPTAAKQGPGIRHMHRRGHAPQPYGKCPCFPCLYGCVWSCMHGAGGGIHPPECGPMQVACVARSWLDKTKGLCTIGCCLVHDCSCFGAN
eukprot:jgi/Mesvir1/13452/Mv16514-RA.2